MITLVLVVVTVATVLGAAALVPDSAGDSTIDVAQEQTDSIVQGTALSSEPVAPGDASYSDFALALAAGADCPKLYEIRNRMDPHGQEKLRANDDLRIVECVSVTSHRRTSPVSPTPDFVIRDYQISFEQCSARSERVYADAGTRDPVKAAEWFSLTLREGPNRRGSYNGCLDALRGDVNRFP